ncbi:MAG TPA: hypothetical protein PLN52_01870 [Opitutaceae bacterium]|nr:hypothetical protein [Opitutaceae bacterium]
MNRTIKPRQALRVCLGLAVLVSLLATNSSAATGSGQAVKDTPTSIAALNKEPLDDTGLTEIRGVSRDLADKSVSNEQTIVVASLAALRAHLTRDGARVRMVAGTYRLDPVGSEDLLEFKGSDAHFDFTGVKFEVDTARFEQFSKGRITLVKLSGDRIVLEGLSLETIGSRPLAARSSAIHLTGRGLVVRNVSLRLSGSYPYGYGSYFGINTDGLIQPKKQNGIRIGGIDNQVLNCRVLMRCFGHAIVLTGAQNAVVKDCFIEGVLRETDEILAEKSGPAFDLDFKQYTGPRIPAGTMTSLSEDGIRAYPFDPETKRPTHDIRVENCRVVRMRRGICLAFASGNNSITGCEVRESERVAYHVQTNTTIWDSSGDALYSQVLDLSNATSKDSVVDLTVLDSRGFKGHRVLATINGVGHRVALKEAAPGFVSAEFTVDVAQARSAPGEAPANSSASRLHLTNLTPARVVLHSTAQAVMVVSRGLVVNQGSENTVRRFVDTPSH